MTTSTLASTLGRRHFGGAGLHSFRALSRLLPILWIAWPRPNCPAQEEPEYGPELTAEELLDSWLGEETAPPPAEPAPARSTLDLRLHGGAGYKRNVYYSAVERLDSAFSLADAELLFDRKLPGGSQISFYGYGEQHHYFELDQSQDDQNATAELAWAARPAPIDTLRIAGTYYYIDQFFDASLSDIEVDSFRLREHDAGGYALVEKHLGTKWSARLAGSYQEVLIHDSDDDYSTYGIKPAADYAPDALTLASAEYEHGFENYHDRPKRDALGNALPGDPIDIAEDSFTLRLRRYLDPRRLWQLRLRGSLTARDDDAGGYYDYLGWRGGAQLRYARDPFSIECRLAYNYLDYDDRPAQIDGAPDDTLYREWWVAGLRAEYALRSPWSGFLEVAYEDYDSNDPLGVYDHAWAAAGVGLDF